MSKRFYLICLPVVAIACMGNSSCDSQVPATSVKQESNVVEKQQSIYVNAQPVPVFDWSLERHLMTELYKARNNAVATYSYVRNQYTGKILSSCPSIGFPISAATQLTSPSRTEEHYGQEGGGNVIIPQPEPNGLFTPAESRGTYVMCLNKDGQVTPRYYEEDVEAYVTPMHEVNGELVQIEGSKASVTINPNKN
jgi:hypothetical protein